MFLQFVSSSVKVALRTFWTCHDVVGTKPVARVCVCVLIPSSSHHVMVGEHALFPFFFFFPKDSYLGVLRLFLRMCRQQGVSSSGVGGRGWAAAGSAAAGSGETRGPGWRRAGRMYNAIFELPQRRFFARNFPALNFRGCHFLLLKSIIGAFSL